MRQSVSSATGALGLDVGHPALGHVHDLAVAGDHGLEAGQLALVDVAGVVAVDAREAVRVEAGFGGVDLGGQHRGDLASRSSAAKRTSAIAAATTM